MGKDSGELPLAQAVAFKNVPGIIRAIETEFPIAATCTCRERSSIRVTVHLNLILQFPEDWSYSFEQLLKPRL